MPQDANNLIWIDMEMSGLSPDTDRVLEVHQPGAVLDAMDDWNRSTHAKSGLVERVKASRLSEAEVESQLVAFLSQHVPPRISPMCGNSVHQDRRFLARHMPALEAYFLYRNLDVSTLKELAKRWKPAIMSGLVKHGKHEALADIHESIEELKYYREHLLKL
jgi:oligoribonuclease